MTRRMLDSGIWANEHFAGLPPMVRLLQIGIINLADDQGRMKAHPAYLRSPPGGRALQRRARN